MINSAEIQIVDSVLRQLHHHLADLQDRLLEEEALCSMTRYRLKNSSTVSLVEVWVVVEEVSDHSVRLQSTARP